VTVERRLLDISETISLRSASDFMDLVPAGVPKEFLTSDLAKAAGRPRYVGQKMAYCLRSCGLIQQVGRQGNAIVYSRTPAGRAHAKREEARSRQSG
jgi:hypothetical protein